MILRWSSSHARSHSSCAPIKTTRMLLPSYNKKNNLLRRLLLCVCVCVVEKTSSKSSATNEDPFQSLSISDYVDGFPKRRKERVLGFWLS